MEDIITRTMEWYDYEEHVTKHKDCIVEFGLFNDFGDIVKREGSSGEISVENFSLLSLKCKYPMTHTNITHMIITGSGFIIL